MKTQREIQKLKALLTVNQFQYCLHLWRPQDEILPIPPAWMVGLKKGQTRADAEREQRAWMAAHGG